MRQSACTSAHLSADRHCDAAATARFVAYAAQEPQRKDAAVERVYRMFGLKRPKRG